jgi:hypothetical protein
LRKNKSLVANSARSKVYVSPVVDPPRRDIRKPPSHAR